MREIAIIDYGAGNLRSVQKAFEKIGQQAFIASDKSGIEKSAALVFPGQGSLPSALQGLEERKLIYPILDWIKSGNPFLGVCLGLQFLLDHSEEGNCAGLGVVPGSVKRFNQVGKVPHMGWNSVELIGAHPIFKNVDTSNQFYFVHSYYAEVTDKKWLKGTTRYGVEFCSVLAHENVIATQFHPEKSGTIGLKLYENFAESMVRQK